MSRVSILIPAYNHEKYIAEAIQSVLDQTYQDFEILITDNGSTDSSAEIIKQFKDPRIKLFTFPINQGVSRCLNTMIQESTGEFIANFTSDDIWLPNKLEKQVHFLEKNPQIGAVFSYAEIIDNLGNIFVDESHFYKKVFLQPNRTRFEWLKHFFLNGNCLCYPSALIRAKTQHEIGKHDERLAMLHDLDLWIKMCMKHDIHILPEKLVKYRVHKAQASNLSGDNQRTKEPRYLWELIQVLKNYLNSLILQNIFKVFPLQTRINDINININLDEVNPDYSPFIVAMLAFQVEKSQQHKYFALEILHEIFGCVNLAEKIREKYFFDVSDLISFTGNQDIFGTVALKESQEQNLMNFNQLQFQFNESQSQLQQTQTELEQSQSQLQQAESVLEQSQVLLHQTEEALQQSQALLHQTEEALQQSQAQLEATRSKLTESQSELEATRSDLENLQSQFLINQEEENQMLGLLDQSQSQLHLTQAILAESQNTLEKTQQELAESQNTLEKTQHKLIQYEAALEKTQQKSAECEQLAEAKIDELTELLERFQNVLQVKEAMLKQFHQGIEALQAKKQQYQEQLNYQQTELANRAVNLAKVESQLQQTQSELYQNQKQLYRLQFEHFLTSDDTNSPKQTQYRLLVWDAWYAYQQGDYAPMFKSLQQSLQYTPLSRTETMVNWLESFANFSSEKGYGFDSSKLLGMPEWQQLTRQFLVSKVKLK